MPAVQEAEEGGEELLDILRVEVVTKLHQVIKQPQHLTMEITLDVDLSSILNQFEQ